MDCQEGRVHYFNKILPGIIKSLKELGYTLPESIGGLPIVLSIPAAGVGAPHIRQRIFIIAFKDTDGNAVGRVQTAWRNWFDRNASPTGLVWDVANNDSVRSFGRSAESEWVKESKEIRTELYKQADRFSLQRDASNPIRAGRSKSKQGNEPELPNANDKERRTDANTNGSRQEEFSATTEPSEARFGARLPYSAWREWPTQSPVCRGYDGIPNRVDRLEALGNAVIPQIPYIFGCFIKQIEQLINEE